MMHRVLITTNLSPDLLRPLLDYHIGCFYRVLSVMEERSEDFREGLSIIARQAIIKSIEMNVVDECNHQVN